MHRVGCYYGNDISSLSEKALRMCSNPTLLSNNFVSYILLKIYLDSISPLLLPVIYQPNEQFNSGYM